MNYLAAVDVGHKFSLLYQCVLELTLDHRIKLFKNCKTLTENTKVFLVQKFATYTAFS